MDKIELDKRVNEVMGDIGVEATGILKKEGMGALTAFVDNKLEAYRVKWASEATPIPLSADVLALREEIERDVLVRVKMVHTSKFNFSSSIEDQAKAVWDRSPDIRAEFGSYEVFLAYSKANAEGRVHIAPSKVIG